MITRFHSILILCPMLLFPLQAIPETLNPNSTANKTDHQNPNLVRFTKERGENKKLEQLAAQEAALEAKRKRKEKIRNDPNNWLIDTSTNCKILFLGEKQELAISWSGECQNGMADGPGTLEWRKNGKLFNIDNITGANGLEMKDGEIKTNISLDNFAVLFHKNMKCKVYKRDYGSRGKKYTGGITILVPGSLDVGHPLIEEKLRNYGFQFIDKECSYDEKSRRAYSVKVMDEKYLVNGKLPTGYKRRYLYLCNTTTFNPVKCDQGLGLNAQRARKKRIASISKKEGKLRQAKIWQEREKIISANLKNTRTKNRAILEENRLKQQHHLDKLNSERNIDQWPKLTALKTNPFPYKDKRIAFVSYLRQMRKEGEGLFNGDVIIFGLPSDLDSKEYIFTGNVVGNATIKTAQGGEVLLPLIRYADKILCKETGCSDYLPYKIAKMSAGLPQKELALSHFLNTEDMLDQWKKYIESGHVLIEGYRELDGELLSGSSGPKYRANYRFQGLVTETIAPNNAYHVMPTYARGKKLTRDFTIIYRRKNGQWSPTLKSGK